MNKKIVQKIEAEAVDQGKRLDFFLAEKLGLSRSAAQRLAKDGLIMLSGETISPKTIIDDGSTYDLYEYIDKVMPNIPVIYEDTQVLVIDKPSGITVHPASGERSKTITELFDKPLYVVHRLDKGTSGVMILAKTEKAADILKKQFADREVQKEYYALTIGVIVEDSGSIDLDLERSGSSRGKIVPTASGRNAVTDFTVISRYKGYTLVSAKPKTGRTHQIRTHLAAIGYPIYGDARYGNDQGKKRIFLHAHRLELVLPGAKVKSRFEADLPPVLADILKQLSD